MKKYPLVSPGEWVKPKRRYYYMSCCDCGLVHRLEFKLGRVARGFGIFLRAWRDNRKTAKHRRDRGITVKHRFE